MSPVEENLWFNTEIKPWEPVLRAYLMRRFPALGDHDDVMQEAYTRVLRAKRMGQHACGKAFLFAVAKNLAIDTFRRRSVTALEPISDDAERRSLLDLEDTPTAIDHQQRLDVLLKAVGALSGRCREVLLLRYLDGLPYKEIAARLGISPNTVRIHMVKGMRDCTDYFRGIGLIEDEEVDALAPEESSR